MTFAADMISNPEFRKNIQLELSPVKLVLMPLVLGMIFAVIYLSVDKNEPAAPYMQHVSLSLFAILVFVWGTKMAIESLISEFNDRTWDSQRMTAISPWALAWGKLFGSSLFAWYGGLFCLLVFAISSFAVPTVEAQKSAKILFIISTAGLCIQATLFSFILTEFAKNRDAAKMNISSYSLVAILLLGMLSSLVNGAYYVNENIRWFGINLHPTDMLLCSSLFFCIWSWISLYRTVRKELQFENRPTAWAVFLISLMIYCAGFISPDFSIRGGHACFISCWMSFVIAAISFYIMLLTEPKHLADFRKIRKRVQQRDWAGVSVTIPTWFISLLFVAVLCVILLVFKGTADLSSLNKDYNVFLEIFPVSLLFFCLRDLGIVLLVNFSSTKKNRDMVSLFYLAILYLLIPILLSIVGAKMVLPWVVPSLEENVFNAIIPIAVQTAVSLHFAWEKLHV